MFTRTLRAGRRVVSPGLRGFSGAGGGGHVEDAFERTDSPNQASLYVHVSHHWSIKLISCREMCKAPPRALNQIQCISTVTSIANPIKESHLPPLFLCSGLTASEGAPTATLTSTYPERTMTSR